MFWKRKKINSFEWIWINLFFKFEISRTFFQILTYAHFWCPKDPKKKTVVAGSKYQRKLSERIRRNVFFILWEDLARNDLKRKRERESGERWKWSQSHHWQGIKFARNRSTPLPKERLSSFSHGPFCIFSFSYSSLFYFTLIWFVARELKNLFLLLLLL